MKSDYPRISIITPSYNQGQFIEETIRSVLLQGYPNLEYIIIDGGSTDNTIDVIKKYEKFLSYWVSEKDQGQSHAINKGLSRISGSIWCYLNSDDYYEPGALFDVAQVFVDHPNCLWVTSYSHYVDAKNQFIKEIRPLPDQDLKSILVPWEIENPVAIQVSNFMSTQIIKRYGLFNEKYHYCMDFDYGLPLLIDGLRPYLIPKVLAKARLHSTSKTVSMKSSGLFFKEGYEIISKYLDRLNNEDYDFVIGKLSQAKYFAELSVLVDNTFWNLFILEKLFRLIIFVLKNPSYIQYRATWGLLRNILLPFHRKIT